MAPNKEQQADTDQDNHNGKFLHRVKHFIHDIGEKLEEAVGFGKPTATVSTIHITSINLKQAELQVDILVTNQNPIPIPLVDINYLIETRGRKLASGLIPDAGTIHARGSETIKVPLTLIYEDIKSTYNDIEPGSVMPYRVMVELIVDVPVIGKVMVPVEKAGEVPVPYRPEVSLEKVKFQKFSLEETRSVLHLRLENKNEFELGVRELEYEVWLGEVRIGGARMEKAAEIGKKGSGVVELPMSFRPKDLGSAVWEMMRGRGTGYSIKGCVDVDSPFGAMKLPFSREGGRTKLQKEGDKDEVCVNLC
ncbi:hypothetical protein J5N97_029047 [Dioscorea zingiberensis]|uniref:Water stress and hypersensitive response domain-containing protein n=1 Tax=Dioscorea zingiberensis TaxID=325984 RepID=A0A9D5C062_9LILI|nr:hypothetical protein J5N97_029047 [Dioscorea zingiberensis]